MFRAYSKWTRGEQGITGLETAIILIAFVVVASVFAYTVLSAGIFSSQKSSEAVYAGLAEAQSTLELDGSVLAIEDGVTNNIAYIAFTVKVALKGEPIDFAIPTDAGANGIADSGSSNVVVISYVDPNQRVDDLYWEITKLGDADSDNILETGEKFLIYVGDNDATGDLTDALSTTALTVDTTFTLEVKPPVGATLVIERTTPSNIDAINNLN